MAPSSPPPISLLLLLFFLLLSSTGATVKAPIAEAPTTAPSPTSTPSTPKTPTPRAAPISTAPLDPNQVRALHSLDIPASRDPCSPLRNATVICDNATPFRHLVSLTLANCSDDVALSTTALKSLDTLWQLHFVDCPIDNIRFPSELASNIRNFTCVNSLKRITGVWLSRLVNVTDLTVSRVTVNASGPAIILESLRKLKSVTISHANLTGVLPKHWHPNLTYVDLSDNQLKGKIPPSLTAMEGLWALNLSHNLLDGGVPATIGDLTLLQNLSLASNMLSGPIPDSLAAMPDLVHLDLGSNQLNGTIPKFIGDMKNLKYLNLANNNFRGILPFNASFFKRVEVLKIGGNDDLCYNHSSVSGTLKLGISPCDRHGLPMSPPPSKDSSSANSSSDDGDDYDGDDYGDRRQEHHHGPNKVVLGVAIGLSSIVFLIIFLVLLSKCCK